MSPSVEQTLRDEIATLRARLAESDETLRAIRSGDVDALIVESAAGPRVFTLQGLDAETNRFRGEILAQVSDAVIATDAQLRVVYLNRAAERQYGVTASEALGRNLADMYEERWRRPSDAAAAQTSLREKGWWQGENIHVLPSGRALPVESNLTVFRDGTVHGFLAVIRDVTDRRHVEAALRESEARYRVTVKNSKITVYTTDCELRYTWIENPHPWLEARAVIGKRDDELFAPECVAELVRLKRQALETGVGTRGEVALIFDGDRRFYDVTAEPLRDARQMISGLTVAAMDITERKLAEEALRESQGRLAVLNDELRSSVEELKTLLRVLPVGVLVAQDPECRTITTNPAGAAMLSLDADVSVSPSGREGFALPFRLLQNGDGAAVDELPIQRAARTARPVLGAERDIARPDGTVVTLLEHAAPLFDVAGKIRGSLSTFVDITERRRVEAEREMLLGSERSARADAERAGKLKDEFLATLSHELRTPLNAILGWAHILLSKPPTSEVLEHGLSVIQRNARSQAGLIADLLDMSRIISGKMRMDVEPIHLSSVILRALESVRSAAVAKGVRVESDLEEDTALVEGDPNRLQQVVWNLLSNAVKFTPRGGRVRVVLHRRVQHVDIAVTDSGIGIRPEFLPHVFERFRQADSSAARRHGGLGLGLSIVKQLVDLHGGSVRVTSEGEGMGSTFTVSLPLSRGNGAASESTSDESFPPTEPLAGFEPPDLSGLVILVVEDDPDGRDLVQRILEEYGAKVLLAHSVEEGIVAVERDDPDVILSDIGLPGRDGYDFVRAIRAEGVTTPAAALTAFARAEDRNRAIDAGYQAHIAKPVDSVALLATVSALMRTG